MKKEKIKEQNEKKKTIERCRNSNDDVTSIVKKISTKRI